MYKLFNVVRDLLKALIEGGLNDPPANLLFFEIFNPTISIHIAYNMYSSQGLATRSVKITTN